MIQYRTLYESDIGYNMTKLEKLQKIERAMFNGYSLGFITRLIDDYIIEYSDVNVMPENDPVISLLPSSLSDIVIITYVNNIWHITVNSQSSSIKDIWSGEDENFNFAVVRAWLDHEMKNV